MSVIHIPRRHYAQHQGRVELAQEWVSRVLDVVSLQADVRNCVENGSVPVVSGTSVTANSAGVARAIVTSGHAVTLSGARYSYPQRVCTDGAFVTVFSLRTTAITPIFGAWSGAPRVLVRANETVGGANTAGAINFRYGTGGGTTTSGSSASVGLSDGSAHTAVFRMLGVGPSGLLDIFIDGQLVASATNQRFESTSFAGDFAIGAVPGLADTPGVAVSMFAAISGAPSLDECSALSNNPWQMFRAEPRRIYSFPSEIVIPTLSALTTTNITTSGARHSLTLSGF